jgi:hypothetical protein
VNQQLAALIHEYVATIPAGHYLFATASGKPMSQRNTLRILHNRKKVGFHAFRRFRTSILRKARVPGDLEKLWLGHASKSVTDDYARQLREDLPFRQDGPNFGPKLQSTRLSRSHGQSVASSLSGLLGNASPQFLHLIWSKLIRMMSGADG